MAPLTTVPLPVRLIVEDYLMLDDAGAFEAYGKTELLDGEIYYRNARYRPHARDKSRLFRVLGDALDDLPGKLEAIVEGSIEIPPHNVPEPDIVVTSEADDDGLVPLSSVRLIAEVADATLRSDLTRKASIYARHAVPEYWVADVNARIVHQLWRPFEGSYADRREVAFGSTIDAATVPGLRITLPAS